MRELVEIGAKYECQQVKNNRVGSPCYNQMKRAGIVCRVCPLILAVEDDFERIHAMFHDGTCFMDNDGANPVGMRAYVIAVSTKEPVVIDRNFVEKYS